MFMKSQHEQLGYGQKKAVKRSVGIRENLTLCSKTLSHGGVEMKVTVLLILIFPSIVFGNYDGYKRNSDGSYVLGGCYDGYKRNSDGSYSVGGMYDGYKRNPNGSYVLGWKCSK